MSREIKFRGLSINGFWYYGLLSISQGLAGQPPAGYYISNDAGMPWAYNVRPETVGQFTGLIDIKGKDIYQGDKVLFDNRLYEVAINFNGYYLQRFKLWRGKFVPSQSYAMSLITKPCKDRFGGEVDRAEVVGNIFENQ